MESTETSTNQATPGISSAGVGPGGGASSGPIINARGADNHSAPAAPAPAASAPIVFPENWKDGLGDEFKADPTIAKYQSIPEMAKAHISLQKMVGQNKIPIPDKLATEQDWKGVFQKLGLPEKAEMYEIEVPKGEFRDDFIKDFKAQAYSNNILPKQAEGMLKWYSGLQKAQREQADVRVANETFQAKEALTREWGEAYPNKVRAAEQAARRFFGEEGLAFLDNTGLSSNIHLVKAFAAIGDILKEHGIKGNPATHTGVTPEDAKNRIAEIRGNPDHPYNKKGHPNKKAAEDEMARLYRAQFPET